MTEIINPLDTLIGLYYNKSECARALGITSQRLNNWISKNFIPFKNAQLVQEKTNGKIKAMKIREFAGTLHNS